MYLDCYWIEGPSEVRPYARRSFAATTNSPDAPYTYEWFVDGVPAGYNGSYYEHTAGSTAFTLSVTIQDAQGRQMHGFHEVVVSEGAPECLGQ